MFGPLLNNLRLSAALHQARAILLKGAGFKDLGTIQSHSVS